MCDCIDRIERQLTGKMLEQYPSGIVVDSVEFQKVYSLGTLDTVLHLPVTGKVNLGKAVRKFSTYVVPTFCPFCGKKYEEKTV